MKILFYLSVVFLLLSCRSIKEKDWLGGTPNPSLIAPVELRIDLNSFAKIGAAYIERMPQATLDETFSVDSAIYYSTLSYSLRTADKIKIFEYEMNHFITDQKQNNSGCYAVLRVVSGDFKQKFFWSVVSGLTLMVPNLFGMPFGSLDAELEIQIDFFDSSRNLIKKYTGSGKGKGYLALYYGFSETGPTLTQSNIFRAVFIKAMKNAMEEIRSQIKEDYHTLSFSLR